MKGKPLHHHKLLGLWITIVTAGFGEAIEGGRAREAAIAKQARAHGVRVIGPNVSGTFNLHAGFNASPVQHLFASPLAGISQVVSLRWVNRLRSNVYLQ